MIAVVLVLWIVGFAAEAFCIRQRYASFARYGLLLYEAPVGTVGEDKAADRLLNSAAFYSHRIDASHIAFRPKALAWLLYRGAVYFKAGDATVSGYFPYSGMLPFLLFAERPWWALGYLAVQLFAVFYFYRQLDLLTYKVLER